MWECGYDFTVPEYVIVYTVMSLRIEKKRRGFFYLLNY
jgi:hypothetical protein